MNNHNKSARTIFIEAVETIPRERWQEFLAKECGSDTSLRNRVQRLLDAHEDSGNIIDRPAADAVTVELPFHEKPGTRVGPYKLLQKIGEGGMGVVYMADQTEHVHRRVALKIIKPGMDTEQVIARFEAERQALAMMDHPNIARVLDVGTTGTGRPYFVMELVNGVPLTQYCDEQQLTACERLELFIPVCNAVQHAHQKGIIHRDLKPTNILVALYDGLAIPKVIDFGIAKAVSQRLTEKTLFTALGQIVGTLDYMSPEQAMRNQLDIDTRSDIYSLGVVLYELLTGDTPFDKHRLRSAAWEEMLRIIREEIPPRPSTKVGSSVNLPTIAANRRTEAGKLSALIRGEIDWIVCKALEKDRSRRYESAGQFAADLRHFLDDEPVIACPPSSTYRLRKFVGRHWRAVSGSLLLLSVLILGLAGTLWQARRATISESIARTLLTSEQQARQDEYSQRRRAQGLARESQSRLSRYYVAEGNRRIEENDPYSALPWFVAALDIDHDDPDRQCLHRLRINSVLRQSPQLQHVLPHEAAVDFAAFSRDGLRLATGDRDGTANIWNVANGHRVQGPFRHDAPVRYVAYSEDGRFLLTVSGDRWHGQPFFGRRLHLWSLESGQIAFPPIDHHGNITFAQLTSDGQRLVTMQSRETYRDMFQHTLQLFDVSDGTLIKELWQVDSPFIAAQPILSPDGHYCAVALDRKLSVFETEHGHLLRPVQELDVDVSHVSFSADGERMALSTLKHSPGSRSPESELLIVETLSGAAIGAKLQPRCRVADSWLSVDGRRAGVIGHNGALWIGELESGTRVDGSSNNGLWASDNTPPLWISPHHTHLATTAAANGNTIEKTDGCRVWNLLSGDPLPFLLHHAATIHHATFHPDEHLLATCGDDHTVRIWNLAQTPTTTPSEDFYYPWEYVQWQRLSDDGNQLLVCLRDIGVQLWDTQSGKALTAIRALRDPNGIPYQLDAKLVSPDCRSMYLIAGDRLQRMNLLTGELTTIAHGLETPSSSSSVLVQFTQQREYALAKTQGESGTRWRIWSDGHEGPSQVELPQSEDGLPQWSTFSPKGHYLALAKSGDDRHVVVFDTATGKEIVRSGRFETVGGPINHQVIAFSPDERRAVIGQSFGDEKGQSNDANCVVQVLDVEQGRSIREPITSSGFLDDMRFSADSLYFFTSVNSRRLKWAETNRPDWNETTVWFAESGQRVVNPLSHRDHASATFSRDGNLIATFCEDGTIRIWEAASRAAITSCQVTERSTGSIAFSASGQMLAVATAQQEIRVFDARTGEAITPPLQIRGNAHELRFAAEDREILALVGSQGGPMLTRFRLDSSGDDVSMAQFAKILSLCTVDDSGTHRKIDDRERTSLEKSSIELLSPFASRTSQDQQIAAWHMRTANECATEDHRDGALFHFDWLSRHDTTAWKPLLNRGAVQERRTFYYSQFERHPDWSAIIADYSAAVQRAPHEAIALRFRSEGYAKTGNLLAAADDLRQLSRITNATEYGYQHAIARLAISDMAGYRMECESLVNRISLGLDDEEKIIWICLLVPGAVANPQRLLDRAAEVFPRSFERLQDEKSMSADLDILRNHAVALIRSGRATEAIAILLPCTEHWQGHSIPEIWLLLALAYAESGNVQESASWQKKGESFLKESTDDIDWTEREILHSLLRDIAKRSPVGK